MRRLPPLNALRSFEAAGRLGSLTAAANELGVTHSAVSQQIKMLEDFLGQRLFVREGRFLRMTPRARHYLSDISRHFDQLTEATEHMCSQPGKRTLRVNTSLSFANCWLIPRLADFHASHPQVEVQIIASNDTSLDQLDEPFDAVIRRMEPEQRRLGYTSRLLLDNVAAPIAAAGYAASHNIRTPADLRQQRLLHFSGVPEAWQHWFHRAGVPASETLRGPYHEQFFLIIQSVINGLGIGLAPLSIVENEIREGKLEVLFPEIVLPGTPFHCLYREESADQDLNVFIDWLFTEAA